MLLEIILFWEWECDVGGTFLGQMASSAMESWLCLQDQVSISPVEQALSLVRLLLIQLTRQPTANIQETTGEWPERVEEPECQDVFFKIVFLYMSEKQHP